MNVIEFLVSLLPRIYLLLIVALLDVLAGALVAVKHGEFRWEKVPEFLLEFVTYGFGWLSLEILAFLPGYVGVDLGGLLDLLTGYSGGAVFLFVAGKYITSVLSHLLALGVLPAKDTFRAIGIPPTTPTN
jgi:hypothetical protein